MKRRGKDVAVQTLCAVLASRLCLMESFLSSCALELCVRTPAAAQNVPSPPCACCCNNSVDWWRLYCIALFVRSTTASKGRRRQYCAQCLADSIENLSTKCALFSVSSLTEMANCKTESFTKILVAYVSVVILVEIGCVSLENLLILTAINFCRFLFCAGAPVCPKLQILVVSPVKIVIAGVDASDAGNVFDTRSIITCKQRLHLSIVLRNKALFSCWTYILLQGCPT